ncbi:hypothetical protein QPK32_15185 [Massilia sp. YIM B02763]|uniref:hypothetical protein n=1 Tax=Massilia sp. YIM B02763 TaxID=3050130 RepID=UPI0025B70702|nr:hypothetical protein [Massilia sp. YIM B02763]MDN4054425.1 hypothetical protein [Massilia sp. YIM B02763]
MSKLIKNTTTIAASLAFALTLSACSTFSKAPPAGAPLDAVTAKLGKPNAVYPDPNGGQVLEYRGQPMGQVQHMARIGADGRLISYEQVLTNENFARLGTKRWTKDDVLRTFGRPADISPARATGPFPDDAEVWSYRYKDDGVWNAMMSVYFNAGGVVLHTAKTPDPILDDRYKGF